MKLLHVGKYYPPYRGGMETVLENLAEGLQAQDHAVSVVVSGQTTWREEASWAGGGRLLRLPRAGLLNSQPLTYSLVSELRREIFRFRPDAVHLHFPNPLAAAAWQVLARTGASLPPLFVWHHADITRQRVGRLVAAPLQRACLKQAAGICVSSQTLLDNSRELAGLTRHTRVVPFGIRPQPWDQVGVRPGGPFLFVGRLVPYKGLSVLLEALARVPHAELVVAGTGPLAGSLAHQAQRLGLEGRVQFTGHVTPEDLVERMGRSTALVLPSIDPGETFGLVQLEAMAAGLPVIATNLPTGVAQVGVPDRTGRLVAPGDVAGLATALSGLLSDPEQTRDMGRHSRERFLSHYTRDRMVDRLVEFYDQGLARSVKGLS